MLKKTINSKNSGNHHKASKQGLSNADFLDITLRSWIAIHRADVTIKYLKRRTEVTKQSTQLLKEALELDENDPRRQEIFDKLYSTGNNPAITHGICSYINEESRYVVGLVGAIIKATALSTIKYLIILILNVAAIIALLSIISFILID